MAKRILAVSSRPSNPVSHLAYQIHAALTVRSSLSDTFAIDYRQHLRTLVGLSFTALLSEGNKIRSCKSLFVDFIRYGNLTRPEKFEQLSLAIAEMCCNAFEAFKVLGYPRYYDDFLVSMTQAVSSSETVSDEAKSGIHDILIELLD